MGFYLSKTKFLEHIVEIRFFLEKKKQKKLAIDLRGSTTIFTGFTESWLALNCVVFINKVPTPMGQGGIEVVEKSSPIAIG